MRIPVPITSLPVRPSPPLADAALELADRIYLPCSGDVTERAQEILDLVVLIATDTETDSPPQHKVRLISSLVNIFCGVATEEYGNAMAAVLSSTLN